MLADQLRWDWSPASLTDWPARLARCGGGFFHSARWIGLQSGGQPVLASVVRSGQSLAGSRAAQILAVAVRSAQSRHGFAGGIPYAAGLERLSALDSGEPEGIAVLAAFDGDVPQACVLVGWANRRAYYLAGGSTKEGYRRAAAVWLHWRITILLGELGYVRCNLGGTPASAASPDHASHGLYRFKRGFGAELVECRGTRQVMQPWHMRLHRLAAWTRRGRPGGN